MKIIVTVLMAASLMACGSKAKKQTTPENKSGTTEAAPDPNATGGQTYGGATTPATPAAGTDPCAGM